jgi:hypothetical protein
MEDETNELSDVVLFELPTCADIDRFHERIRPRWRGWTTRDDEVWLVAAEPSADAADFAVLLREVEAYVAETGLHAIRFCVDGRFHILEACGLEQAA